MSEMPSSAISFSVGPLGSSLATSCSSRSCSVRSLATACNRCPTPLSGRSALAIAMMRPRNSRLRRRREHVGVDAQRHHVKLVRVHAEVGGDVGGRRRRDGQQLRNAASNPLLHRQKAVPPAHRRFTPPACRGEIQHPVAGDRVVHGRHHGQAGRRDGQQSDAQALVVVHDVEVVCRSASRRAARRLKVRGSGKPAVHTVANSSRSMRSRISRGMRDAEGVGFAVHVEAGHLGQHDPRVEFLGVGLTGKHLDVVSQFDQARG